MRLSSPTSRRRKFQKFNSVGATPTGATMIVCITILVILIILMPAEYLIHKYLMHKRLFANAWIIDDVFKRHSLLHHKDERNDTNIDLEWWYGLFIVSPFLVMTFFLYPIGVPLTLAGCSLVYCYYWTKLHRAFHEVEANWIMKMPWYEACKKHHMKHHEQPNKNLGTVFWFTDYLFRTKI